MVGPGLQCLGGMARVIEALEDYLHSVGIEVIPIDTGARNAKSQGLRMPLERVRRLFEFTDAAQRVALSRPSLLHCHSGSLWTLMGTGLVVLAARIAGKRVVLTLHGGSYSRRMIVTSLRGWPLRLVLRLPTNVTSTSPELAEIATAVRDVPALYIPNALPSIVRRDDAVGPVPDDVRAFMATHTPNVVFVGAMLKNYGALVLVNALAIVRESFPRVGCVLIAYKAEDARYAAEVQRAIRDHDMTDSFMTPRTLPSVSAVVASSDLMARPCYPDANSIAVSEALALGVRVVASRVLSRPPSVTTFEPWNVADLAASMLACLAAPRPSSDTLSVHRDGTRSMRTYLTTYMKTMGVQ
jgi:glycosyltransferase involved in cell wall biosynthesis